MAKRPRAGRLEWVEGAGRYRDPVTKRFVSRAAVRADIDAAITEAQAEMRSLGEQLRTRKISVKRWEVAMRQQVKRVHVWNAAAAKGGRAQLTQADLGRVGQRVREQYQYLRKFAREVASGKQPRDGRLGVRVAMYAQAGRQTYHAVDRLEQEARGMTEERSIKHAQDSCQECIAARDASWQPVGTLPLPGERECLTNCKCEMEYRAA